MKKVFCMMAVAGLFSVSVARAQVSEVVEIAEVPVSKYSVQTNSFWDNWFVSLNAGAQFSYLYPEGKQEFKDRISFSGLAYVGKWFTPGFGVKAQFGMSNSKGFSEQENWFTDGDPMYTADGTPYWKNKMQWTNFNVNAGNQSRWRILIAGAGTVTAAFQPGYFGDGTMLGRALIMCLCDYVLAYSLLGLGGCFRNRIKNSGISLMCGSLVALGCRYLAHIISGYVLFAGWAEWFFTQEGFPAWGAGLVASLSPEMLGFTYSLVYNGMYILPEMIFTAIAALFITRAPHIVEKVN